MKNEPQTASELMLQNQLSHACEAEFVKPKCALPNETVQKFLLDVIDQTSFPGKMSEFVVGVKKLLSSADIG
jgi:hypothetical protein